MDSKILIKVEEKEIIDGRWKETLKDYYSCWCTPLELYGKELYAAENIKFDNVLVFKVRYCNKIKEMRTTEKNKFIVIFDNTKYQVYQVDFKGNSKDYVYIKAKMVI
ncbi:phage head closure protein [Clostridium cuniculi]|uniref:phage head closure protein n=1 Tax=Clostridium cuniculi TaxID=2548455 RepID=UPI001056B886|nr:phage head closure protein [Clostridium cuniculi]